MPTSFQPCWSASSRFSRTLLPALVIIWILNGLPSFSRVPPAPLVQPAWSSSFSALALSKLYLGVASLSYAQESGGIALVAVPALAEYIALGVGAPSSAHTAASRTPSSSEKAQAA